MSRTLAAKFEPEPTPIRCSPIVIVADKSEASYVVVPACQLTVNLPQISPDIPVSLDVPVPSTQVKAF